MRGVPLVLSAVLIVAVPLTAAKALDLSRDQERRLEGGEVVVVDELPPGGMVVRGSQGGTGLSLVHASAETVWQVLVNYAHHPGMYPRVVRAQVLESGPEHALVRYVIGVGPFSFGFHVDNYLDEGRRRIVWRLAQERPNDLFRDSWGYWQIDVRPTGVLLTYGMAARTVLPAFLTRRAERDGLVETLKAVRERAERLL
jgi:ribosome-associated toxin RatA of RatAB toxin-antitoxin module